MLNLFNFTSHCFYSYIKTNENGTQTENLTEGNETKENPSIASEKWDAEVERRHQKTKKDLNDMMMGKTRALVGCFLVIDKIMSIRNKEEISSVLERTKLNKTMVTQRIQIDLITECEAKVNDENLPKVRY